jgi:hypothetical protein
MAINSNIALGFRPTTEIENPVNQLAKVLAVRGAQQQQDMQRMQADEYRTGVERKNKLYGVLGQDYASPEERENALMKGGFADEALKFGKDRRDNAKADVDRQKAELESHLKRFEVAGQIMSGVNDQASWDMARQRTAQVFGPEAAAQMPPQYDPVLVEQKRQQAMAVKDQVAAKHQALVQAETVRHNTTTEGLTAQGQAVTMRGQNMVDSRSRESNSIQQQAARTQVVETPDGVMLIDKATAQARPATAGGKPLQGKPSAATEKEMLGLRQQDSIIDGAIAAVDKTPDAFSMGRGMATMAGAIPESIAGRFDNDAQRQARSYVFNNVSKVINERAGAAQSAQELARLRSFLPAETDNADQIKSKLQAFKSYLSDMQAGTKAPSTGGASGGWSIQRVSN